MPRIGLFSLVLIIIVIIYFFVYLSDWPGGNYVHWFCGNSLHASVGQVQQAAV